MYSFCSLSKILPALRSFCIYAGIGVFVGTYFVILFIKNCSFCKRSVENRLNSGGRVLESGVIDSQKKKFPTT